MLKKAVDYIRPPLSRQDAPIPEFVLARTKPLRTALGKEPAAAGSGRAGEMNPPRLRILSGLADDLFEHSA